MHNKNCYAPLQSAQKKYGFTKDMYGDECEIWKIGDVEIKRMEAMLLQKNKWVDNLQIKIFLIDLDKNEHGGR